MDMTIAGFIALAALIIGLFACLHQDVRELRRELRQEFIERTDALHQDMVRFTPATPGERTGIDPG